MTGPLAGFPGWTIFTRVEQDVHFRGGGRRRGRPNRYYAGPPSDHFDGRAFFNPEGTATHSLREFLRWRLGNGRAEWPSDWPSPFGPARPKQRIGSGLCVTMVGHASLLIQAPGVNILADPVWSRRASPLPFAGPRRVNAPGIAFEDLPPIDLVLVSHNHYDHLDLATLRRLQAAHDPLVVTPLGNDAILKAAVPGMRVATGDWGDAIDPGAGTLVHLEPAHHWSARGTRDRRMALWAAFVVETPAGRIYHVGDTGFHEGRNYRTAAAKYRSFRLALLPIGAYAPRWFMQAHHQNPEEAVEGMLLANAAHAIGHHWGTFRLTDEPIGEPAARLADALRDRAIPHERFRAMRPGEVWHLL